MPMIGRSATATRTFPRRPTEIAAARAFVRSTLAGWSDHRIDGLQESDLVLMASELFTNAVLHGAGDVEVVIALLPDRVRVTVCDEGHHEVPRQPLPPRRDGVTGRGLRIVDRLASAWGSDRSQTGGTAVWLEVPRR